MLKIITADVILIVHFLIILFICSMFFLIPIGYKLSWKWLKKSKIRVIHLSLMIFITVETIIGISCPLTVIENYLRGIYVSNSFMNIFLSKIIFWNLPKVFFMMLYILCLLWTVFIWFKFPPERKKR